jgi:hypothetical protein
MSMHHFTHVFYLVKVWLFRHPRSVLRLVGNQWQALAMPSEPVYLRAAAMTGDHRLTVAGGKGLLLSLDTRPSLTAAQAK